MISIRIGSWLIENLNLLTVLNVFIKVLKDVFETSFVPDIDNEKLSVHRKYLNLSTVLNAENVALAKVLKGIFKTSLAPDIDNEKFSIHCITVVLGGFLVVFLSCYFSKEFFSFIQNYDILA